MEYRLQEANSYNLIELLEHLHDKYKMEFTIKDVNNVKISYSKIIDCIENISQIDLNVIMVNEKFRDQIISPSYNEVEYLKLSIVIASKSLVIILNDYTLNDYYYCLIVNNLFRAIYDSVSILENVNNGVDNNCSSILFSTITMWNLYVTNADKLQSSDDNKVEITNDSWISEVIDAVYAMKDHYVDPDFDFDTYVNDIILNNHVGGGI